MTISERGSANAREGIVAAFVGNTVILDRSFGCSEQCAMGLFDGMETFARVVEAGSFTATAVELGITKSSVSEQVRRLEDRMGVRLLERNTRRLAPTEAGQAFYARCRRAIHEAASGRSEARALQVEPKGRIRAAVPECFSALIPVLASFLDENPSIQVELIEGVEAVDLIAAEIDVAIRVSAEPAEQLIVRRIGTSRVVIAASPAYLEAHAAPLTPADLPGHRCLAFSPLFWAREWRFDGPDGPVAAPVRPELLTNSTSSLLAAARAGLGLAPLPQWVAAEDLRRGALVPVLSDWRLPESGIYAVYPSNRLIPPKVRRFVEQFAAHLRSQL